MNIFNHYLINLWCMLYLMWSSSKTRPLWICYFLYKMLWMLWLMPSMNIPLIVAPMPPAGCLTWISFQTGGSTGLGANNTGRTEKCRPWVFLSSDLTWCPSIVSADRHRETVWRPHLPAWLLVSVFSSGGTSVCQFHLQLLS